MGTLIDTPEHDAIKSKTAGPYAGREAEGGLESVVDAQLVRLVDLIKRKYVSRNGELVQTDFSKISRFFTLDVISKLLFGTPWGHLDEGIDVLGWCVAMDDRLVLMFLMMELPALRYLFGGSYGLLRWFGPQPGDKSGLGVVMGYVNKLIGEHFTDKDLKQKDMMSGFIRNGLSEMECQGEALLVILAGSDTSAVSYITTQHEKIQLTHPREPSAPPSSTSCPTPKPTAASRGRSKKPCSKAKSPPPSPTKKPSSSPTSKPSSPKLPGSAPP